MMSEILSTIKKDGSVKLKPSPSNEFSYQKRNSSDIDKLIFLLEKDLSWNFFQNIYLFHFSFLKDQKTIILEESIKDLNQLNFDHLIMIINFKLPINSCFSLADFLTLSLLVRYKNTNFIH
ncbi:hypothetical protein BpHYR1_033425 [Brachionus plicatilis]|uniref:Uncharacterized protein n=1 Tax=Brachionus plicatilis TaxID=10195 RepID=A0A3M7RM17_BRAPC|nr:hypothetical protein BpHYR1_033425 [Brachionus plicatilis]